MVDIRSKPVFVEPTAVDATPLSSLTPPSRDLMERLHAEFAICIPREGHAAQVANEVAEMRGAWKVIQFLQSVVDARTQENN